MLSKTSFDLRGKRVITDYVRPGGSVCFAASRLARC
jgi:hypothetical protein